MNVLYFQKKLLHLILYNVLSVGILFLSIWLLNIRGVSLFNIALGTVAGYMIFYLFVFMCSSSIVMSIERKIKILLLQFGAMIFTGAVYFALENTIPSPGSSKLLDLGYTAIKMLLGSLACLPLIIYGIKLTNAWEKVKEEISSTWSGWKIRVKSFNPVTDSDGEDQIFDKEDQI
jgi:H+/gluconate symporter-like permease